MQKTILAILLTFAPLPASAQRNRKVKVITDYGTMTVRLYDQTPLHRAAEQHEMHHFIDMQHVENGRFRDRRPGNRA